MANVDELVAYFGNLTEASVDELSGYYAEQAYFKDPFNEVHGIAAIQAIFRHMFRQVSEPRFVVTERLVADNGVMLAWDFRFRFRGWKSAETQLVRGVSHLRFDAAGKITYHRDYWDAAEELYAKLPLLGLVMGGLQRALRT
ncbi:MAG: nuclear transport factor 2 family protein [Rhodocyclaceae bacterium]|jgi:steroid Delta-isomerase